MNECPHHHGGRYRECHHSGDDFVAVYWDAGFRDWISTYGTLGKRGSTSALASKELPYMLSRLYGEGREEAAP